jgi:hypothetical protein
LVLAALASLVAVAPALYVASSVEHRVISLILGCTVFGIGYLGAAYLVGVFHETEIQVARSWLRRLALWAGRQGDPPLS